MGTISRRLAVFGVLGAPAMMAHRQHTAYTSVTWSTSSRRIAVTHRLEIDDARIAVLGSRSASLASVRAQAMCAFYVSERFSMSGRTRSVELEIIGAEVEGRHVFVYQEGAGPPLRTARIASRIFMDAFPEQINRVNIDMGWGIETLIFTRLDGTKSVVLD